MSTNPIAEFLNAIKPENGVFLDQLDPTSNEYLRGKSAESSFTIGVNFLRRFPDDRVRKLGATLWDVCHHKHVAMGMGPKVRSLTFAAFGTRENLQGVILVPENWADMIMGDSLMQLGAIVMVGSQAVDFYNGKVLSEGAGPIERRAKSNEAHFLRKIIGPFLKANDYQKRLMEEYPTFDPALDYEFKAVEPAN